MFPYIETKEALKANFSYLTPGQAPYYWILACLEFTLFKAAIELSGYIWFFTTSLLAALVMVCVARAMVQMCETQEQTEISQLRVARIVGISTALLSLAITMSRSKLETPLYLLSLAMSCIQAAVFLLLVKEEHLEQGKSANIPQLLVICTSLIFATHAATASLSTRHYLVALPEDLISGYGKSIDPTQWPTEYHVRDKTANFAIKEDAGPVVGGLYGVIYDAGNSSGVHQRHVAAAEYQVINLSVLALFLGLMWIAVLCRIVWHSEASHIRFFKLRRQ